jgi:hypothetical protein
MPKVETSMPANTRFPSGPTTTSHGSARWSRSAGPRSELPKPGVLVTMGLTAVTRD